MSCFEKNDPCYSIHNEIVTSTYSYDWYAESPLCVQVVYGISYSDYEANEESVETIMAQAIVAVLNNQVGRDVVSREGGKQQRFMFDLLWRTGLHQSF